MKTLVIGYGNTLRGDDGVGYRVAEMVEAQNWKGISAIACHQLTPELAAAIAVCDCVIFVDATLPGMLRAITVQPLQGAATTSLDTHHSHPAGLLNLAAQLYDAHPQAYQILLPTEHMDFGETLSAIAQRGMVAALQQVHAIGLGDE